MDVMIGKVMHYYDKIGVAVVVIKDQPLKVRDLVKVSGHDNEFIQTIASIQVGHKQVSEVAPNDICGVKVDQPVKAGDVLYLTGAKK